MGTCQKCKSKIEYNAYKVIKGIVYCSLCSAKLAEEKKQAKRKRRQKKKEQKDEFNPYAGTKQDE